MNLQILDSLWQSRAQSDDFRDLNRLLDALSRETTDLDARYQLDWRRARAAHFDAMLQLEAQERKKARAALSQGAEIAQWTLRDGGVEGRFWWAVCLMEAGQQGGKWASYWALRAAKPQFDRAATMNESFHFAGPLRVLGRIAHLAPPRLGGGAERARQFFERALEIAENSTTRLYFADLLSDLGEKDAAKTQIEAILAAPDDQNWGWEQARDRKLAREWLQQNS